MKKNSLLIPLNILGALTTASSAFTSSGPSPHNNHKNPNKASFLVRVPISTITAIRTTTATTSTTTTTTLHQSQPSDGGDLNKAPTFNGQLTLPIKIITSGLHNHKVAAVYAILSKKDSGWKEVRYVSITRDLNADLQDLMAKHGTDQISFVRAVSFAYPQKTAMMEVADRWKAMVMDDGGSLSGFSGDDDDADDVDVKEGDVGGGTDDASVDEVVNERSAAEKEELVRLMMETADFDDDDDDDEFEFDDDEDDDDDSKGQNPALFVDTTATTSAAAVAAATTDDANASTDADANANAGGEAVSSPFEIPEYSTTTDAETQLTFNLETVDKVLDEIRPYLISDGGNVSVHSVNEETKSVYLILEGACGSCPSSTVTMQMGIERILKENFEDLGEVAQIEPDAVGGGDGGGEPEGLTMEAVMREVNRIGPAITAMGGNVEILSVDPLGVVEVQFRGANKVQQGLELALRDVPYVKHVKFVN